MLDQSFYDRPVLEVARNLIGKYIVRDIGGEMLAALITEAEAYGGEGAGADDRASHAYGGRRTSRTDVMFCRGGCAYVYLIYGMYPMVNIVAEREGIAAAVLLRAGEIVAGHNTASKLRYDKSFNELTPAQKKNLANGPGKLCKALGITTADTRASLFSQKLYITQSFPGVAPAAFDVVTAKRVNIDYAGEAADFPWRFIAMPPG
ncbi:MAG: DNA-3-methyladenine glycosylase [Defluviitaleaceae bacterium]|nr:DNA-3-methyladenine glycosylase [Defluviitaleaceae bacterium]